MKMAGPCGRSGESCVQQRTSVPEIYSSSSNRTRVNVLNSEIRLCTPLILYDTSALLGSGPPRFLRF